MIHTRTRQAVLDARAARMRRKHKLVAELQHALRQSLAMRARWQRKKAEA